eukprot:7006892-Prymnesium_polylepis.1
MCRPPATSSSDLATPPARRWYALSSSGLAGPLFVLAGAWSFAGANAVAKTLYSRGVSECTLFLFRSPVVYLMNVTLVWLRKGQPHELRAVVMLTVDRRRTCLLLVLRSCLGFTAVMLLNLTMHYFLSFADTFSLFLGVMTCATVIGARVLLGSGERLGVRELCGGGATLVGIVLITQPPALFAGGGSRVPLVGVFSACLGGAICSGFNVCSRLLASSTGTYRLSPALLLSYYMVTIGVASVTIAALSAVVYGGGADQPAWTRLALPTRLSDWFGVLCYCVGILAGQLLNVAGFARTAAGRAAILSVSELAFAFVLDVAFLQEPT